MWSVLLGCVAPETDPAAPTREAGDDSGDSGQDETVPTLEIISPSADTDAWVGGMWVELVARARDEDDPRTDLVVAFSSDIDGPIEVEGPDRIGRVSAYFFPSEGDHLITGTVTDPSGQSSSAEVELLVGPDRTPWVDVDSPDYGAQIGPDELLLIHATAESRAIPVTTLEVSVTDEEYDALWQGSPDSDGAFVAEISGLPLGPQVLIVWAYDGVNGCGLGLYWNVLVDTSPTITVTSPSSPTTSGPTLTLVGTATDPDPGDVLAVSVVSDLDGVLAEPTPDAVGAFVATITMLSAGSHVLTVTATDGWGAIASSSISVDVE